MGEAKHQQLSKTTKGDMLPPPLKRQKVVLEEDEYTKNLGNIIERDFFPNINKMQSKLEWLHAVKSGNPTYLQGAQRNIMRRRAGYKTPIGDGYLNQDQVQDIEQSSVYDTVRTDISTPQTIDTAHKVISEGTPNLSVNQYLAKYTSEDNASFEKVMDFENEQRHQKFLSRLPQKVQESKEQGQRFLTDGYGTSGQEPKLIEYGKNPSKNNIYFGDRNSQFQSQLTEQEFKTKAEGQLRETKYENTNFPNPKSSARPLYNQQQSSEYSSSTLQSPLTQTPLTDSTPLGRQGEDAIFQSEKHLNDGSKPRVYNPVETPQLEPNKEIPAIMTWGEVEGTPLQINDDQDLQIGQQESDIEKSRFKLQDENKRDALARVLASKSKNKDTKSIAGFQSSFQTPGTTPYRTPSGYNTPQHKLSEAGRNLYKKYRINKNFRGQNTPQNQSFDIQLRSSYSRTPIQNQQNQKNKPQISNQRTRQTPYMETPLVAQKDQ